MVRMTEDDEVDDVLKLGEDPLNRVVPLVVP